ncbi:MAG: hypothetical protein DCF16_15650 [Alphaproteobacteria bacterium]|nr:MAG: hypothetical protein DCF16_15650 [Alphaproteobacteria bacterium]
MFEVLNRDHITDALAFWEPARIVYNLVLAIISAVILAPPLMSGALPFDQVSAPMLIVMAVLANVAYCAAYPIDLFVQASAFRDARMAWRAGILLVGIVFAGALTWLVASAAVNATAF